MTADDWRRDGDGYTCGAYRVEPHTISADGPRWCVRHCGAVLTNAKGAARTWSTAQAAMRSVSRWADPAAHAP